MANDYKQQKLSDSTNTAIGYSTCHAHPSIQLFNCDNLQLMAKMEDESVDVILTDPPYLYLKNQKLEREFDEQLFFSECKRILTKNGFIVLFGRGTSFYRWNTILDNLGFTFKEEIIWDKCRTTSPVTPIGRKHETIAIFSKGIGGINKIRVPFLEKYKHEPEKIKETINRIATTFGNRKTFELLKKYYNDGIKIYEKSVDGYCHTRSKGSTVNMNRTIVFARGLEEGITEQSLIKEVADWHTSIHPTQKPVRLLERLLALVIPKDKPKEEVTVLDPFGGSFSTMEAVYNMGMKGISCEINEEYYELGKERIENLPPRQTALFD